MWSIELQDVVKVLMAMGIGGLIGLEREYRDKAAGVRTMMLICAGSALFMILSIKLGGAGVDKTRIAANIVSGVGFLGAGAIIRETGRIMGLTTAATIWIAAALGMGVGAGMYGLSVAATAIVMATLLFLPPLEHLVSRRRIRRDYRVACLQETADVEALERIFADADVHIRARKRTKIDGRLVCEWETIGSAASHAKVAGQLLADDQVVEMRY